MMHGSHLDPSLEFNDNQATLTLIRIGEHAQIAVELIENKSYACYLIHLTGVGFSRKNPTFLGNGFAYGNCPFLTSKAEIELVNLSGKSPRYHDKSRTWIISQCQALAILEQKNIPSNFNLYGAFNVINVIKQMIGYPIAHSCITWASHALYQAGIKIDLEGDGFNLLTITSRHISTNIKHETELSISELCHFIRSGDLSAILNHFTNDFPINKPVKNVSVGPVESFLGYYNPLSLAVAYGKIDIVRLLIEDYGADPNQLVGRLENFTALDCARKNFWFTGADKNSLREIDQFLCNHGGKTYQEIKHTQQHEINRSYFL